MSLREDIKAYIDGELNPERAEQMRRAIEADPELQAEYAAMKDMTSSIASLVRQPQVRGAEQALQRARPNQRKRWLEVLLVTGVFAIVAAVTVPMFAKEDHAEMAAKSMEPQEVGPDDAAAEADTGTKAMADGDSGLAAGEPEAFKRTQKTEAQPPAAAGVGGFGGGASPKGPDRLNMAQEPRDLTGHVFIRTAELSLEVPDPKAAAEDASNLVLAFKGKVDSTELTTDAESGATAKVVFSVPADKLDELILKLSKDRKVAGNELSSEDVTTKLKDLEIKVKDLRAKESDLKDQVQRGGAGGLAESHLLTVRTDLGTASAELDKLKDQVKTTKLTVVFTKKGS